MLLPKYVNPADSSQTWTGCGVPPVWVVEIRKFGDLENCLIDSLRNSEQPKKALRNYQQTDWTGEQGGSLFDVGSCLVCGGSLPFQFGSGRPASYCSNACKMKAYRQRNKQPLLKEQQEQLDFVQFAYGRGESHDSFIAKGFPFSYWIFSFKGEAFLNRLNEFYQTPSTRLKTINQSSPEAFAELVAFANADFQALLDSSDISATDSTDRDGRGRKSVESASNTHTKVWYPILNNNKAGG